MNQDFEAVLLAGGSSSRMRFETKIPKQLLPVYNTKPSLQYQLEWLKKNGIKKIVMAIDEYTFEYITDHYPYLLKLADASVEKNKLGTGGAIKKAVDYISSDVVYVHNVDDFILSDFYTPDELVNTIKTNSFQGAILTSRARFPYGVIKSRGKRVIRFQQKPLVDWKVSAGHYAFNTSFIKREFPSLGSFEDITLPKMTRKEQLTFLDLDGDWVTVNTWKELIEARKKIEAFEARKRYGIYSNQFYP